ncbi:MAG: histidinol-phosphate transaminase [Actinomycetota bacterium]
MTGPSPRDDIRAMSGYHSPQVEVAVRLNTNESPFPPPAAWVEELATIAARTAWNRYPDREATELRAAIARRHAVEPGNIFVANGSNEVLQTIMLAYGGAGRTVATFEPTYQMYAQIARVTGAAVVSGERRGDHTLDADEVRRVVADHSPSITMLCNPNNPTGIVEPRANLEALLAATDSLVVVDEAYAEFSEWSAVPMVDQHPNLVVTRTFSKTLSLAALRVGYAIAPAAVVEALSVAVLPYHLDEFKPAATVAALRHVTEMNERVAIIRSERRRIEEGLAALGLEVFPSGANFVLFRTGDARAVWNGLLAEGVLVRDCSGWDRLAGCLRVTVGTPEENGVFLGALAGVLDRVRG